MYRCISMVNTYLLCMHTTTKFGKFVHTAMWSRYWWYIHVLSFSTWWTSTCSAVCEVSNWRRCCHFDWLEKMLLQCVFRGCLAMFIIVTLLLWRNFIWPHLDAHDNHALEHMLEYCGKHVRQFTLSGYVMLFEFSTMLDCCKQIGHIHLLRSTKLHPK